MFTQTKMEIVSIFCFVFSCLYLPIWAQYYGQPEQIHLSYGDNPNLMRVTWVTFSSTNPTYAQYGRHIDAMATVQAEETKFVDQSSLKIVRFIYWASMNNLVPGNKYVYRVGNNKTGWSSMYHYIAQRNDSSFAPRFVVIGDLGNSNPQSLPRLQLDTEAGMYDAMLHVGDFAYDMYNDNGTVGDQFFRQIQPIASQLPYMTCPGNHESTYNFSHYKNRFTMPTDEYGERMYYSIDIGPVHLISFSSEYLFQWKYVFTEARNQYKWLEEDLKKATTPEARAKTPWIITMAHRPMYCSNNDNDDCTHYESLVRSSMGFEALFYKYGVDLCYWAHEHSYERLWPIYNFKMRNGSYEYPYINPKGIVHIITGSAGCDEDHDKFQLKQPPWSAFRSNDYSYTRMQAHNATHLSIETVSDDQDGKIIDKMTLIKHAHGPYE